MGEERGLWRVGLHGLLLGQGKVSFERLTPKSQKIKVWDSEVSPQVERS